MAVNRLGDPGFLDGKAKSKSFRDALSGDSPGFSLLKVSSLRDLPSLIISDEELLSLAAPFEFALVGKFLGRRLPLDLIQKFFFNLKMGGFSLTDRISLLTRFMKLLKWSPIFDVNVESPIVPVP
ncbi:uncharacterized protein LOC114580947 isoform X2 [Dendrobium catenatum]|uniref:uncharacterized protein LOC114580947 isoform X2 n=1 Tax=Dendrobium catenatum TaxID=906689 RepID=UPI00109FAB1E|nr:uncharacterized protein LOC114580947 isoform X2 [Dendrobium catenatum]